MVAAIEVTVGGVTFYGTEGDTGFRFSDFDGWNDAPEARGETIERPDAHGDFDTPVTRGPRLIMLSGWVFEADEDDLEARRNQLMGILADGRSGTITVKEYGTTLTATVRLWGDPRFKRRGDTGYADWSIRFRAPNPRKYGATHNYGPGSTVNDIEHDGNFPASSVLTVAGSSGGGYTVTGPGGRVITVVEPLVSGHPHTIDLSTSALVVDGARVIGGISVFEPWTVPVGSSISVSVSAGTVAPAVKDTYV